MRLNLYTDIGLKVIMYLKVADKLITLTEISKQFNIPRNHLIKVANHLVKLNWIIAIRGRNGGLKYNLATDNLKLGNVILVLEGKKELLECEKDACKLRFNCILRGVLSKSVEAFYATLNSYTIADITSGVTKDLLFTMQQQS